MKIHEGIAIIVEQLLTKSILIAVIGLHVPITFLYVAIGTCLLLDAVFMNSIVRRLKKNIKRFDNIILSRLSTSRPIGKNGTAQFLENHMSACQANRIRTDTFLQEEKTNSIEFSKNIKNSVYTTTKINGSVIAIHEKITDLNDDILNSMSAIEQITQTILSLKQQIEDQSSSVEETSASIAQMDSSIHNVKEIAKRKEEASHSLVARTEEGKKQMVEMGNVISTITDSIGSIQKIVDVINDIATSTNLLSMNAAIEAAHAGASGKGFAVVAGEIRKLSQSTGENAARIDKTIKAIIANIKSVKELSIHNLNSYDKVRDEATQIADAFQEITSATSELSVGSDEIVKATQLLIDVTASIQNGAHEISASSTEIRDSIQRIVSASRESSAETSRISEVAQTLNLVFLHITETMLKNEKAVSQMRGFHEHEFEGRKLENGFDGISLMLQHLLWVIRARGVIDNKMDIDASAVMDHQACNLGKWIESGAAAPLRGRDDFKLLVKDHERLHDTVRDIVTSSKDIDRTQLEQSFDDLLSCSERIIETLLTYDQELNGSKASVPSGSSIQYRPQSSEKRQNGMLSA